VSGTSIETGVVSSNSAPFVVDRRKAALGREEFARLGCAACHGLGPGRPSVAARSHAKPFGELDPGNPAGCLSPAPGAGVPLFRLNEAQRTALRTALASRARFRQPLTPKERVNQTLVGLNCVACHARDGVGGPTPSRSDYFSVLVAADLGDEGRIPPHLTGVGIKLRPEWSREVLLNAGSVRPYMATRMPQYGKANVAGLIDDFQRSDAAAASAQTSNSGAGDVQIGRLLVGVGGYSCISCHNFAQHASLGISVMDLTHMGKRLQPGWFFRYLADPASLRPGTRMPTFWPDGKSTNQEILGGDQARQIHSIWSYLTRGPKAGLPPGLAQAPAGGAGNRPSPGSDKSP
jgi:mono/diheme cytochrome c family protein